MSAESITHDPEAIREALGSDKPTKVTINPVDVVLPGLAAAKIAAARLASESREIESLEENKEE